MTTGSSDVHEWLGAYVLGGLSDDDHRTFSEHLRTCRQCQSELGQVSGLPRLLDLAGPGGGPEGGWDATSPAESPSGASSRVELARLLGAVAQRRRRRRLWLGAGSVAASLLVFALGALVGPQLFPSEPPTTRYDAAAVGGSSAKVEVALVTRGWGTQVDLVCEDLPTDGELRVWVIDASGRSSAVASWRATSTGNARVTGATALRPNEIRTVQVRTATGAVLARAST